MTQAYGSSKYGGYFIFGFVVLLIVMGVDQYTKWFMMENILKSEGIPLNFKDWFSTMNKEVSLQMASSELSFETIEKMSFLTLVMVFNTGVSFGMMSMSSEMGVIMLIGLSLSVSIGMLIWLAMTNNFWTGLALGLITGGAIGNVIDRIRFGAVVDFLDFHYNGMHWPAFNVADICISLGAFIIVLTMLFAKNEPETVDV